MPLLMEQVRTGVKYQDLADNVVVNGMMIQMRPVQVTFVKHRLNRQIELEVQSTQTNEVNRNAISERSQRDSI